MGYAGLLSTLAALWAVIHVLHRCIQPRLPSSTSLTVSTVSLHLSTTALNAWPKRILSLRLRSKRKSDEDDGEDGGGVAQVAWDVGALLVVAGLVLAQGVLVWAAVGAVSTIWSSVGSGHAAHVVRRVKRAAVAVVAAGHSRTSSMVLKPVIPGLTIPLSSFPLLLLALFLSQSFHELGHALAAASDGIPVLSVGVHLYILLPTFYVALPSSSHLVSNLRVATAGVYHNVVLCLFIYLLTWKALGPILSYPFFTDVDGGVLVVGVDSHSPLRGLVRPWDLITHLDDLELDQGLPTDVWADYLRTNEGKKGAYDDLGWCVPLIKFSPGLSPCCDPTSVSSSVERELCFALASTRDDTHTTACMDPLPFFPPSHVIPPRCLRDSSCYQGFGCARPRGEEMVLRIAIAGVDGGEGRTVVWQGKSKGVLEQVSVTDSYPRYWWVPLSWPRTINRFYAHVLSLSLTLAFFNLLPLPSLDGSHIISTVFECINQANNLSPSTLEEGSISNSRDRGLLEQVIKRASEIAWVRKLAREGEKVERGMRTWTILMLGVVGIGSLFDLSSGG